jgi:hypothetical protein
MSGGGSGGQQTQMGDWAEGIKPYWQQALGMGNYLTGLGLGGGPGAPGSQYQKYPGQRIADFSQDQQNAMGDIRHFVGSGGSPATIAANGQIQQTLDGNYLNSNPYSDAHNGAADQQNPMNMQINPWQSVDYGVGKNQYAGMDNPAFKNVLKAGQDDITSAYNNGTSAELTRMMNMSGAFGGSAHLNAMANNQNALAKQLGNYESGMQNDQYNRSAQLSEADISRNLQNDMANKQLGGQWFNDTLNRTSGNFENQYNRQAGAQESAFGRGNQNYENERQRQVGAIGAGQNEQQLALQRFQALMGVGDANRGMNQDQLNMGYQDWQDQQNYPLHMLDTMTGLLSRAQGGIGGQLSTSSPGYQANPLSQLFGGLLAYNTLSK